MRKSRLVLGMCVLALTAAVQSADQNSQPMAVSVDGAAVSPAQAIAFETLALGDHSGYGWHIATFTGADLVIQTQAAWQQFWMLHTGNVFPPPEMPYVDFTRHFVLAVIQGPQTSGGMPAVYITGVVRSPVASAAERPGLLVTVVDDERPGPLDVITNPYHIVAVPRMNDTSTLPPVRFRHIAPALNTGVVRGRVFAPADSVDWLPLPGARVRLALANSTTPSNTAARFAITGRDGSFYFVNVPPGLGVLTAVAPPYATQTATVQITADTRTGHDFYLLLPNDNGNR